MFTLLFLASVLAQTVIHQQFDRQGGELIACPAFVRLADNFFCSGLGDFFVR
jgi:hypothetical protein